jgi:hypothetical protein
MLTADPVRRPTIEDVKALDFFGGVDWEAINRGDLSRALRAAS